MSEFNYIEAAKSAIKAFDLVYYAKGDYRGNHFWNRAEMIEMIEDACDNIDDDSYKSKLTEMCETTLIIHTKDWSRNPFYDDIAWMCLAFARASKILDNLDYAEIAKTNLNYIYEKGRFEDGATAWKRGVLSKHSITACTFSIAACVLGDIFSDESYYAMAIDVFSYVMTNLFNPDDGRVYDKILEDGTIDYAYHSYLQGVFVGACCMLYEHTSEEIYKTYADKAFEYVFVDIYPDKEMNDYNTDDAEGFKAILSRWARKYALQFDKTEYIDWLRSEAESAYNNRNKYGLMQNNLHEKTKDHKQFTAFDCHSAVTVLINAI